MKGRDKNKQMETGLEKPILNSRVSAVVVYYMRTTHDNKVLLKVLL